MIGLAEKKKVVRICQAEGESRRYLTFSGEIHSQMHLTIDSRFATKIAELLARHSHPALRRTSDKIDRYG